MEERGYLHVGQSSILAGRMAELERSIKKDTVHRELDNRPDREELINRGILSTCSMIL